MNDLDEDLDDDFETITIVEEDGSEREFIIIDALEHNGKSYLLVADAENYDDEPEALILKQVNSDEDSSTFCILKDDEEINKIAGLFSENDEYDIEF